MYNATAITTGSANQQHDIPSIRLFIDVIFHEFENSYEIIGLWKQYVRPGALGGWCIDIHNCH